MKKQQRLSTCAMRPLEYLDFSTFAQTIKHNIDVLAASKTHVQMSNFTNVQMFTNTYFIYL